MSTEKTSIGDPGSSGIPPFAFGGDDEIIDRFDFGGSDQIGGTDDGIMAGGTREGVNGHIGGSGLGKWWPFPSYIPTFLDSKEHRCV